MSKTESAKLINGFDELDESIICYFKQDEIWYIWLPKCGLGNLTKHSIEEHTDGTISVTPSILVTGHDEGITRQRHGYLTKGVWKEV